MRHLAPALAWTSLLLIGCPSARAALGSAQSEIVPIRDAFVDANGDGIPNRKGQEVTIRGVVLADPVPLSGQLSLADVQDETAGTTLFSTVPGTLIGRIQRGDVVVATGKIGVYRGNHEVVVTEVGRIGRASLPPARDVTIAELRQGKYLDELVRLRGDLTMGADPDGDDTQLRDATGTVRVHTVARFFENPDFLAHFQRGGKVEITGISNRFGPGGDYRLLPRDSDDFRFAPQLSWRMLAEATGSLVALGLLTLGAIRRRQHLRQAEILRENALRAAEERDRALRTANEELERRVQERTAAAQEAESLVRRSQRLDSLGTLASGVAHDLNNALTPIMVALSTLREKYPNDAALLNALESSSQRGADMVRQLLSFSKRSEGRQTEIRASVLLEEVKQIALCAFPKNIRIELACPADLPTLRGDSTQIHQVLLNLCVNARDAMPGGGTLRLAAAAVELGTDRAAATPEGAAGRYVALEVGDTGTGMTPEIRERIFDPFFTTKSPDKGTGLGLSMVRSIVSDHHGFVQVETGVGRGSTFRVLIPVEAEARAPAAAPRAGGFRGRGETILVVDDEPAVRSVAELVLRHLDFNPLVASDGREGLALVAEHRQDLRAVVTDLHMPGMGGLDFLAALRESDPKLPVIVISGRLDEAERSQCGQLGVGEFIEKPFTELQLAEHLHAVLS
jgi:signal transduction histidine kinase